MCKRHEDSYIATHIINLKCQRATGSCSAFLSSSCRSFRVNLDVYVYIYIHKKKCQKLKASRAYRACIGYILIYIYLLYIYTMYTSIHVYVYIHCISFVCMMYAHAWFNCCFHFLFAYTFLQTLPWSWISAKSFASSASMVVSWASPITAAKPTCSVSQLQRPDIAGEANKTQPKSQEQARFEQNSYDNDICTPNMSHCRSV